MMPLKEIKSDPVRLNGAIDLELMQGAHVVCVGIGGAMGLCEDLVRCGLGKLTAIDFDEVDATNIHTQGFDLAHIGLSKVEALSDRLQALNQELDYTGIQMDFLEPSDDEVDAIVSDADILLMMTDNFHCQARGNLISMRTSIPTVFAAAYHRGRGAEVTFNIPGTTSACHRCATWSRYEAYDDGFENDIGSAGSCVMITHYLNAVLGHVILAIMHRDASDCEFAGWFDKEWNKNLIQVRLSPKLWEGEETLFDREYGSSPFSFAFEALWSSITPVSEDIYGVTCPDCQGTGGRSAKIAVLE
jgi:molybdopterin/thiamine biosynthesis adenylyltransferase